MKHFAHFFIGKEFVNLVAELGKNTFKYGGDDVSSYINLFLLNNSNITEVSVSQLVCTTNSDDDALAGFEQNIEISWGEESILKLNNIEKITEFYSKNIFSQILTINKKGNNSVLHVVLHFPLYKPEALEIVKCLYDGIESAEKPTKIDFIGYADDLAEIIDPGYKISSPSYNQISHFSKFKKEKKMNFDKHFVAIQNTSNNGISLGLNLQSLSHVISQFSMLLTNYYDEIFPNTAEYKDVVSFGLSSLFLDKYLFVEYLFSKTILNSIDNSDVNKNDVDVNLACDTANHLLKNKVTLLSDFFIQFDGKNNENGNDNFTKIQKQFEEDINQIIENCKDIFRVNNSITTRAAILAAILSKTECELFSQSIFNHDAVSLDSLFSESIDYFIDNNQVEYYKLDDEPIINPVKELKLLNMKLINSESEIRELQELLSTYEKQISDVEKVENCFFEDGFYHFQNKKFRLLPSLIEEPLEDTYQSHETSVSSIDLRQNFNSIKNQGQQGSCLSFSITSIFEYPLKLNQTKEYDLSEAFLYYNAREMDSLNEVSEKKDTGSRFKPAMDSLVKYGIALEKLCPYNENRYDLKPSEEAYKDGISRRLIKALNVNRKVVEIKSALADGYPVAASFALCPSFKDTNNGFIPMPSEQEIEEMFAKDIPKDIHFRHAMVITGFSDQLQMFVVRNSWGDDWGENGYCYLPYQYVEHEKLCDFSCIITEIESVPYARMEQIPSLRIDDTDLNIKFILTKKSLVEEIEKADTYRKQRDSLRIYFERIKRLFSAPNERDEFIKQSIEQLKKEQDEHRKEIKIRQDELEAELRIFNKDKKNLIIHFSLYLLGFFVLFVLLDLIDKYIIDYIHENLNYLLLLPIVLIISIIVFIKSNIRWKQWRDKRDEIDDRIIKLNKTIAIKEKAINEFKIKTFSAWAVLRTLEKVQAYFQHLYGNIISLINNLRTWYSEISDMKENISLEAYTPNNSLLSKDILDTYFTQKLKDNDICKIELCEDIENHKIEEEYLKNYKKRLFDGIAKNLINSQDLSDFDISAHIVDNKFSNIAMQVTRDFVDDIENKSDLFLHISSNERGEIIRSTGIYAPSLKNYRDKMRKRLGKYSEPYFESNDMYRLVFVKTATLWFKECVMLRFEK